MLIKMFSKVTKIIHVWSSGYDHWYRIIKMEYTQPCPFLWIGIWFHMDGYEHPHSFERYELQHRWDDDKNWRAYRSSCGIGDAWEDIAEEIERILK